MDYVRCFLACNVHVLAHVIDGCMFLEEYALNESLSIQGEMMVGQDWFIQ